MPDVGTETYAENSQAPLPAHWPQIHALQSNTWSHDMKRLNRSLLALSLLFAILSMLPGSGTIAQGSATLDLTLRGCAEGIDPHTVSPAALCTIPLDAPAEAGAIWGGDGQGGMPMTDVQRLYDGTYRVSVPANQPIALRNFEPSVRDAFMAVGTSGTDRFGDPMITLNAGVTARVSLYYYFEQSQADSTLLMTFRGCPTSFNAATDDFFTDCTIPLDAPDASIIVWGGDGQGGMEITALDRQYNGAYVYTAGSVISRVQLSGLAPVVRDSYQVMGFDSVNGDTYTINLTTGETRNVFIFYFYE